MLEQALWSHNKHFKGNSISKTCNSIFSNNLFITSSDCHISNILWCLKKCSEHFWVNPVSLWKGSITQIDLRLSVVDIIVFYWFGHHRYRWLLQNWTIKSKYLVLVSLVNITPYPTVVKLKIPTGPCIWC